MPDTTPWSYADSSLPPGAAFAPGDLEYDDSSEDAAETPVETGDEDRRALPGAAAAAYSGARAAADADERERMLMEQLPQVRYVARRIHERLPAHIDFEDLVQAGVMGLIDAIHKYDPTRNASLVTYARFRIRGAILDSLRALDWSPRELRRSARDRHNAEHRLHSRLGRAPHEAEIAAEMGLDLAAYHELVRELNGLEQAEASAEDDTGFEHSPLDLVASVAPGPFAIYQRAEIRAHLVHLIEELPERDRQILNLYYYEELTMKEVGAVLGIGESRISQLHSAALKGLREKLRTRLGISASAATTE